MDTTTLSTARMLRFLDSEPVVFIGEPVPDQASGRRSRPSVEPARRRPWLREWLGQPLVQGFRGLREGLRRPDPVRRGAL